MRGYVYILSNRSMPGLLKVGYTTRSVVDRVYELNSTGVPTSFHIELYFEVNDAPKGERLLHRNLGIHHFKKEFFKVSVAKAVEESKKLIYSDSLVVYGVHGSAKDLYLTEVERQAIEEQLYASRAKEKIEAELRILLEVEAESYGIKFLEMCPRINLVLKNKSYAGRGGVIRTVLGIILIISVVGLYFGAKLMPIEIEDGEQVASKLTADEKLLFQDMDFCIRKLRELKSFEKYASIWHERLNAADYVIEKSKYGNNDLTNSNLLVGVFIGLAAKSEWRFGRLRKIVGI